MVTRPAATGERGYDHLEARWGRPAPPAAGASAGRGSASPLAVRLRPERRPEAELCVTQAVRERPIEWASLTTSQGESSTPSAPTSATSWTRSNCTPSHPPRSTSPGGASGQQSSCEAGFVECERLGAERPTIVLGPRDDALSERLAAEPKLRERLVVYDLAALAKAGAVRSSVAVLLEWFLRDAYGVKVLASAAFTQGLVSRGVTSLGMG
jgi:hypothetical protein